MISRSEYCEMKENGMQYICFQEAVLGGLLAASFTAQIVSFNTAGGCNWFILASWSPT